MPPSWMKRNESAQGQGTRKSRLAILPALFQSRRKNLDDSKQTSGNQRRKNNTLTPYTSRDRLPRGETVPNLPTVPTIEEPRLYRDKPKDRPNRKENSQTRIPVPSPSLSPYKNTPGSKTPRKLPKAFSAHDIMSWYASKTPEQDATPKSRQTRETSHEIVRQSFEEMFPASTNPTPRGRQSKIPSPPNSTRAERKANWHVTVSAKATKTQEPAQVKPRSPFVESDDDTTSTIQPDEFTPLPESHHVYDAEPSAYWSGRFMSLNDKYRAQDNAMPILADTQEAELKIAAADKARVHKVFTQLYQCCQTDLARKSFESFVTQYAKIHKMPEILSTIKSKKRAKQIKS